MKKYYLAIIAIALLANCATYKTKYSDSLSAQDVPRTKEILHTIYLIGDAGLSPDEKLNTTLEVFKKRLSSADTNSTAIFLGDNIYPAGLPERKDTIEYGKAKHQLDAQLETLDNFKGRPLFIPGNHDWYANGLEGLERQQRYIEKRLEQKKPFLPENGCPLKELEINDELTIIVVDTEWYLTNWNKHPTINDNCDIKSREMFWQELLGLVKKNSDKTTLIAMHHPMFSYGPHGGQFSLKRQLYPAGNKVPLPVLGSIISVLRKTTGASPADVQNKRYADLKSRMITLSQYSDKVIFASGHEHTLQYIKEHDIPQIVSGSGAKKGAAKLLNGSKFSTGRTGYSVLEIYTDGSSAVRFYGTKDLEKEEFLFYTKVHSPDTAKTKVRLTNNYDINTYQPLKERDNSNLLLPSIGYNPDDGFKVGLENVYTKNGLTDNSFVQQHTFNGAFSLTTSGYKLGYKGEFAQVFEGVNFELNAKFTNPNFAINFFGFGNETENFDDELKFDFNRVRIQSLKIAPALVWRGQLGSKWKAGISYEYIDVEETENRFINTFFQVNQEDSTKKFASIDGEYTYQNSDNKVFPTLGMTTSLEFGYKLETGGDGNFGYIIPTISFDHKLIPSGRLVLATKFKWHFNIGNDFEFYQGASIGGVDGLRGFRNRRFTGKSSYYQNTDVKYSFSKIRADALSTVFGIYGGFDYGRIWLSNDTSNVWHTSYGGGLFLNATNLLSLRSGLFNSTEGSRFSFALGFRF